MNKSIYIINKNSNEIYALTYPRSIQNFCEYDFSYFHDRCVELCNEAIKTGDYDPEQLAELRSSLKGCHIYYEQNIRLLFERIVTDCWIDYLCRKDSVGTAALWSRYMGCNTPFERTMFNRLCEYRYNHAINQWLNIIRIQEYARKKLDFLFDKKASGADEVKIRRNYFDLMFNVTACELGCDVSEMGTTSIYTPGRIPSSQFIMSALSKDILKSNLSDLNYDESFEGIEAHGELSDQLAMDAFARMKNSLPKQIDTMNIAERSMKNLPERVYIPSSFKAVIDLEFDVLLADNAVLQRCAMCGRYYVKDSEYTSDYCNKVARHGMTCLEIYERDNPKSKIPPELQKKCDEAEIYMLNRMGKDLSRAEYDGWRDYLHAMMGKVESGEMAKEELESFVEYSKKIDISKSEPVKPPVVQQEQTPRGVKTVRPFVPERVDRSVLEEQQLRYSEPEPYFPFGKREANPEPQRTVPVKQRTPEKSPTARIIRGGTQNYKPLEAAAPKFAQTIEIPAVKQQALNKPDTNVIAPQKSIENTTVKPQAPAERAPSEELDEFLPFIKTTGIKKNAAAISAYGKAVNTAEQIPDELAELTEAKTMKSDKATEPVKSDKVSKPAKSDMHRELENPFADISSIFDGVENSYEKEELLSQPEAVAERDDKSASVIRNAKAAAYEPADFTTDFSEDKSLTYEQGSNDTTIKPVSVKSRSTDNSAKQSGVPNGIWTEERQLFAEDKPTAVNEPDELTSLISKRNGEKKTAQKAPVKRKSTNKTQHVFDAILKGTSNDKNTKK